MFFSQPNINIAWACDHMIYEEKKTTHALMFLLKNLGASYCVFSKIITPLCPPR